MLDASTQDLQQIWARLKDYGERTTPPTTEEMILSVKAVKSLLMQENPSIRPQDNQGLSGGYIRLIPDIPTILVPDLHARRFFLLDLLQAQWQGAQVMEQLAAGSLQILCVGDGFHAEKRGALRWKKAFQEYQKSFKKSPAMDEEMTESLGLMAMVILLKLSFPDHFHFLKGNHENIRNEYSPANRPFGKFAYEGEMVKLWTEQKMGEEFLEEYGSFEDNLPVLAQGIDFLVSHAEPAFFYPRDEVIDYRSQPSMIFDFTWTANDDAQMESVKSMLEHYLPDVDSSRALYFGGHRPVNGLYNKRARGKYIQFHNPQKEVIVVLEPDGSRNPENIIKEI